MRIHQLTRRIAGRDEGATAILVAILSVVLIGIGAFAVDVGQAYAVKRTLSVAADAAALDAVSAVASAVPAGQGCNPSVLTSVGAQAKAQTAATTTNAANDLSGKATLTSVSVDCDNSAISVTVSNQRTVPSIFGGVFGVTSQGPVGTATARAFVPDIATGLRPFAACADDVSGPNGVKTRLAATTGTPPQYGDYFVVWISREQKVCNSNASGQWGFTNFLDQGTTFGDFNDPGTIAFNPGATCAGGSPSSGGNAGCQEVWVDQGYNGGVGIPNPAVNANTGIDGNSGLANSTGYRDALDGLVGDIIQIPVATDYVAGRLSVIGIVSARVCAVKQSPGSITTGSCYAPVGSTNPLTGADLNPWTGFKNNEGALQVQYVNFTTSSVGGPIAGCLGNAQCDNGTRAVSLFR